MLGEKTAAVQSGMEASECQSVRGWGPGKQPAFCHLKCWYPFTQHLQNPETSWKCWKNQYKEMDERSGARKETQRSLEQLKGQMSLPRLAREGQKSGHRFGGIV